MEVVDLPLLNVYTFKLPHWALGHAHKLSQATVMYHLTLEGKHGHTVRLAMKECQAHIHCNKFLKFKLTRMVGLKSH